VRRSQTPSPHSQGAVMNRTVLRKLGVSALLPGASLSALLGGIPAMAADMLLKAPPPQPPVWSWTGCHLGGDVGLVEARADPYTSTGSSTVFFTNAAAAIIAGPAALFPGQALSQGFTMEGSLLAGLHGGCDYQTGAWVFGLEGDWSYKRNTGTAAHGGRLSSGLGPLVHSPGDFFSQTERSLATLRGRLGYAYGSALFYVTGGAALTRVDNAFLDAGTAFSETQTDTLTGWTVGAGLEYALGRGWSVRGEYLYVNFPTYTTFTNPALTRQPGTVNGYVTNLSTKLTDNIVRVGVSYKFDWGGTVVARY
jgi:outer membrane immunogenic protein